MKEWRKRAVKGFLLIVVAGGCATHQATLLSAQTQSGAEGVIVRGNNESLDAPNVEENQLVTVALIAVKSIERPGALVKITHNLGPGVAAFVEVVEEASAADVRRAFARLGMYYATNLDPQRLRVTYVGPTPIPANYDNDPFFETVREAVERLWTLEQATRVNGYGEAYAILVGAWVTEMNGKARRLVPSK